MVLKSNKILTNQIPQQPDQRARFIEAARELGADEDQATLAVIARQKPKNGPEPFTKDGSENKGG